MKKFIFGMVNTSNSREYTPLAVESFHAFTPYTHKTFFLIDNNSDYNQLHEHTTIIKRDHPKSFSENANELIKIALDEKSDLFFLNNDIIFSSNWLEPFLNNSSSIQVPSSNNQYQYQTNNLNLTFSMDVASYRGHEKSFQEIAKQHCARQLGLIQRHSTPYYCVHIPYEILKLVGLFDERFSPYGWEDTDYTVRAYYEGIPVCINSNSYILHFFGKSTWNKDGQAQSVGDAHCAKLFIEKWNRELADIFGYQKENAIKFLEDINPNEMTKVLRDLIWKSTR